MRLALGGHCVISMSALWVYLDPSLPPHWSAPSQLARCHQSIKPTHQHQPAPHHLNSTLNKSERLSWRSHFNWENVCKFNVGTVTADADVWVEPTFQASSEKMQTRWAECVCSAVLLLPSSLLLALTLWLSSPPVCVSFIDGRSELLSSPKQLASRRSAHSSPVSSSLFPSGNLVGFLTQYSHKRHTNAQTRSAWCTRRGPAEHDWKPCAWALDGRWASLSFLMFLNFLAFSSLCGGKRKQDIARPGLFASSFHCLVRFKC